MWGAYLRVLLEGLWEWGPRSCFRIALPRKADRGDIGETGGRREAEMRNTWSQRFLLRVRLRPPDALGTWSKGLYACAEWCGCAEHAD